MARDQLGVAPTANFDAVRWQEVEAVKARSTHTGTQTASTISNFDSAALSAVLLGLPFILLRRTSTQAPTAGSWQALTHNVVDEQFGITIVGTNQYRPDTSGWYVCSTIMAHAGVTAAYNAGSGVSKNGSTTLGTSFKPGQVGTGTNAFGVAFHTMAHCYMFCNGTTDYVQPMVYTYDEASTVTLIEYAMLLVSQV